MLFKIFFILLKFCYEGEVYFLRKIGMAGATIVQQPTNNDLKQLFQDLNKESNGNVLFTRPKCEILDYQFHYTNISFNN